MDMGELAGKFAKAAGRVDAKSAQQVARFAQVGVGYIKRAIQDFHAVDTGTMLNSTTAEKVGEATYLIGPTVKYAPFIALGTSRMAARPFHTKAAEQLRSRIGDLDMSATTLGLD